MVLTASLRQPAAPVQRNAAQAQPGWTPKEGLALCHFDLQLAATSDSAMCQDVSCLFLEVKVLRDAEMVSPACRSYGSQPCEWLAIIQKEDTHVTHCHGSVMAASRGHQFK